MAAEAGLTESQVIAAEEAVALEKEEQSYRQSLASRRRRRHLQALQGWLTTTLICGAVGLVSGDAGWVLWVTGIYGAVIVAQWIEEAFSAASRDDRKVSQWRERRAKAQLPAVQEIVHTLGIDYLRTQPEAAAQRIQQATGVDEETANEIVQNAVQ